MTGAGVVGPTISLECTPHVQSYTMAFNATAAQFAVKYWAGKVQEANGRSNAAITPPNDITNTIAGNAKVITKSNSNINSNGHSKDAMTNNNNGKIITGNSVVSSLSVLASDLTLIAKQQLIADLEVGVSTALLAQGFPLIALDPRTHTIKFQQQLRRSLSISGGSTGISSTSSSIQQLAAQSQARQSQFQSSSSSSSSSHQCDVRRNPVACRINNDKTTAKVHAYLSTRLPT